MTGGCVCRALNLQPQSHTSRRQRALCAGALRHRPRGSQRRHVEPSSIPSGPQLPVFRRLVLMFWRGRSSTERLAARVHAPAAAAMSAWAAVNSQILDTRVLEGSSALRLRPLTTPGGDWQLAC